MEITRTNEPALKVIFFYTFPKKHISYIFPEGSVITTRGKGKKEHVSLDDSDLQFSQKLKFLSKLKVSVGFDKKISYINRFNGLLS